METLFNNKLAKPIRYKNNNSNNNNNNNNNHFQVNPNPHKPESLQPRMQEVHLEVVGGGDAPLLLKWTDLEDVIDPEGEVFDGFAASSSERSTRKTAESEIVLTSRSVDEVLEKEPLGNHESFKHNNHKQARAEQRCVWMNE